MIEQLNKHNFKRDIQSKSVYKSAYQTRIDSKFD